MNSEKTTILVSKSTRQKLIEISRKNETYDEAINHLLEARKTFRIDQYPSEDTGAV